MLFPKPDFGDVLTQLTSGPKRSHVTAHVTRPSSPPRWGTWPQGLHPAVMAALEARGHLRPYSHQSEAIGHLLEGRNLLLTTPTASGKTLCYNVPVLHSIANDREARALYLFPTKALSQDQYAGLHALIEATGLHVGTFTFDGDTRVDARRAVRDHGQIVITNPDMLHAGILPQHTKWVKLFENLRYIVIDELHTYRGIFGTHVAHVLHRLLRICRFYGADPQIICCSATIANPMALAEALTGRTFAHVTRSGAPRGEHHFISYNPPVVNAQLGIRAGVVKSALRLARDLILADVPTIVFAGSRLQVEILLKYLRGAVRRARLSPDIVQGYRGGYLPGLRRRIEAGLRSGDVRCVVTTNALELGLDIGSLQACIIAGYPGSIASLRQQSGRAGRRTGTSLTVYIARSSALDQYLVNHPTCLTEASPEHARVNPRNLFVLIDHLKCAAFELPFEPDEAYAMLSVEETSEALEYLARHQIVHRSAGRYHWMARVFPAHQISLRGVPEENFVVIDAQRDRVLAEVDFRSAHTTLHEHAIHNIDGQQYQVERLDYENHKAYVRRVTPDYYTTALTYTRVAVLDEDGSRALRKGTCSHGDVRVTSRIVGFKKVKFHTNENVGYGEVGLPDLEMHTTATWITLCEQAVFKLPFDREALMDGLVGLSHALHTTACVHLMCAARDLGSCIGDQSGDTAPDDRRSSTTARPADGDFEPTIFLYDAMPGGVGLAEATHRTFTAIAARAVELLDGCPCGATGCPACLGAMPRYDGRAKAAARALADLAQAAPQPSSAHLFPPPQGARP